jgi:hypothetical protein
MTAKALPESIDGFPNICGSENVVARAMARPWPLYLPESSIDFDDIKSGFAIALHMHQPLVPGGGQVLRSARIISNLRHMLESPHDGDRYNAGVFHWCYKRMGEFIPDLVREGKHPRIMLEYSGTLLHGLREMGLDDVLEALQAITCDPLTRRHVEWLGMPWGHAVAPSTAMPDYRLHVRAWQHHFAAIFGPEALGRVRGFSPSEMALPNHPDVAYEFIRILKDCGYRWVLVQEHTVERPGDGGPVGSPHLPHRLVAKNSLGQTVSITAIIKTQGSDTKIVAQMQPHAEAHGLSRATLAGRRVPPLVTQIADGENGGVMMNEFPPMYLRVTAEASGSGHPPVNVTEYLEYLQSQGLTENDFAPLQPLMQKRIWDRFHDGDGPQAMNALIAQLKKQDGRFHVEGGSWTSHISWVRGYENILGPMAEASILFDEKIRQRGVPASAPHYREALFHLLLTQTSCYRYWGKGLWTDYGRELCRRTIEILNRHF